MQYQKKRKTTVNSAHEPPRDCRSEAPSPLFFVSQEPHHQSKYLVKTEALIIEEICIPRNKLMRSISNRDKMADANMEEVLVSDTLSSIGKLNICKQNTKLLILSRISMNKPMLQTQSSHVLNSKMMLCLSSLQILS